MKLKHQLSLSLPDTELISREKMRGNQTIHDRKHSWKYQNNAKSGYFSCLGDRVDTELSNKP